MWCHDTRLRASLAFGFRISNEILRGCSQGAISYRLAKSHPQGEPEGGARVASQGALVLAFVCQRPIYCFEPAKGIRCRAMTTTKHAACSVWFRPGGGKSPAVTRACQLKPVRGTVCAGRELRRRPTRQLAGRRQGCKPRMMTRFWRTRRFSTEVILIIFIREARPAPCA